MALRVLDGNQTATTLSSVVTGGEHIVAHSVVSLGANAIANIASAVSGSVVSISNFPSTQTVAGTVTANLANVVTTDLYAVSSAVKVTGADGQGVLLGGLNSIGNPENVYEGGAIPVRGQVGMDVPISGTVTAHLVDLTENIIPLDFSALDNDGIPNRGVQIGWANTNDGSFYQVSDVNPLPISGTVTVGNSVTIGSLPSGSLTTRFGSVTTANTAQITSAVTNTSRKYLLAQNISAGTVTIGIGFSPTTTQGIQLTAGGGLTFDSFCPTGAVYWLGAVTGAAFTILEG